MNNSDYRDTQITGFIKIFIYNVFLAQVQYNRFLSNFFAPSHLLGGNSRNNK